MGRGKKSGVGTKRKAQDDTQYLRELIERAVDVGPRRLAATECERKAQEIFADALDESGVSSEMLPFRFNDNLYASVALHSGTALTGSALFAVSPGAAFVLHALAAASYVGDSTKKFFWLRRLFKFKQSQNLVATVPAEGEPALRIVLVGHADAAFTGRVFDPKLLQRMVGHSDNGRGARLERPLFLTTFTQAALAGVDLLGIALGPLRHILWPAVGLLSIPSLIALAATLDVVIRDEVVPGANDNLTGCAALPVLASRLVPDKPVDVELVFVAAGAEEAGLGGSWALSKQMRRKWDTANTVILGIDGLSNGDLRYFDEAEIVHYPLPPWLVETIQATAATDPRFAEVEPHYVGVGHTDAYPFKAAGYDAVTIGCIDPKLGAPRHYHIPSDTPENLEWDKLAISVDFVEQLVRTVIQERLG